MQGVKTPLRIKNPETLQPADCDGSQSPLHTAPRSATRLHTPHSTSVGSDELHQAVYSGNIEKVKGMLSTSRGRDSVNLPEENDGFTPLMTALSSDDNNVTLDMCTLLLRFGADASKKDKEGNNSLHWAARLGKVELVKLISFWPKDGEMSIPKERTEMEGGPQLEQSSSSDKEIAGKLRIDLMVQNKELNTPLHEASLEGHFDCCRALLSSYMTNKTKKKITEQTTDSEKIKSENTDDATSLNAPKLETLGKDSTTASENIATTETGVKAEALPSSEPKKELVGVDSKVSESIAGESSISEKQEPAGEKAEESVKLESSLEQSTSQRKEMTETEVESEQEKGKQEPASDITDKLHESKSHDAKVNLDDLSEWITPHKLEKNSPLPPAWMLLRNKSCGTAFDVAAKSYRTTEESKTKDKSKLLEISDTRKILRRKIHELFTKCFPFFKTLILFHEDCLGHVPVGENIKDIWEAPERLRAILSKVGGVKQSRLAVSNEFPPASREMLLRAHSKSYVDFVHKLSAKVTPTTPVPFTPRVQEMVQSVAKKDLKKADMCDTSFSKGSLDAALRSCGAVVHAIDQVVSGQQRNAFCIVRPPGHHAGIDGLMDGASSCGFCIFNNVMVGTLHAMEKYPDTLKRVAIIDFDVHHGNGTEEIVLRHNSLQEPGKGKLLFFSTHLFDAARPGSNYEFYPGSGKESSALGNVFNVPLAPLWRRRRMHNGNGRSAAERFYMSHFGRQEFRRAVVERMIPALRAFQPDMILVSAGFDAGYRDVGNGRYMPSYKSGFDLKREDFFWVTHQLVGIANMCCNGRVVSVLEGGYGRLGGSKKEQRDAEGLPSIDRASLARNCVAHIAGLLDTDEKVLSNSAREALLDSGSEGSEAGEEEENNDELGEDGSTVNERKTRVRRLPARFLEEEKARKEAGKKGKRRGRGRPRKRVSSSDDSGDESSEKQESVEDSGDVSMDDSMEDSDDSSSDEDPRKRRNSKSAKAKAAKAKAKARAKLAKAKGRGRGRRRKQSKGLSDDSSDDDDVSKKGKRVGRKRAGSENRGRKKGAEYSDNEEGNEDEGTSGAKRRKASTELLGETKKKRTSKQPKVSESDRKRELKKGDALQYLRQVKKKYENDLTTYKAFLSIMGDFKNKSLDVMQVTARVKALFRGDNSLIMGFNTFLPDGYQIKLQDLEETSEPTSNVVKAENNGTQADNPQQQQQQHQQHAMHMQSVAQQMPHFPPMYGQQHYPVPYLAQWPRPQDAKEDMQMPQQQQGYPGYFPYGAPPPNEVMNDLQMQAFAQYQNSMPFLAAQQMAMQQHLQQQHMQQAAAAAHHQTSSQQEQHKPQQDAQQQPVPQQQQPGTQFQGQPAESQSNQQQQ